MTENEKKFISLFSEVQIPEQYEKYSIHIVGGKPHYSWQPINDKLIKNPEFNWNNYFELPEKINYRSSHRKTGKIINDKIGNRPVSYSETEKTGYQRPVFRFISIHISSDEFDECLSRFNLKIGEEIEFTQMPVITSYRDSLLDQMKRQAVEINKLNQQLADALKVYYFETEQANNGQINDHIRDIYRIFLVLKGGIDSKQLKDIWIFDAIRSNPDITDHLKEATIHGISHLCEKKDPLLKIAEKLAKEIYVLESVIEDKFLNNKVSSLQEIEEPDPRLKFHSENYFDTALKFYRDSKKNNSKGLTWPEVYEKIIKEENELGMENKYTSFDSFDTVRKRNQREQSSSK